MDQIWLWHQEWGIDEAWRKEGAGVFGPFANSRLAQRSQDREDARAEESRSVLPQASWDSKSRQSSSKPTDPLASIQTLEELRQALDKFDGCALKETALKTVFSDGNPASRLMVVGEAPGADEDRLGKPFVGLSGQLLDRIFAAICLDRTQIYISNIVPWRPPGNRQPTTAEIQACLPFIERHISLIAPQFLLVVGGTAAKALLKRPEGITRLRGSWIPYQNPYLPSPIMTLATFHPAYLLRSPGQKRDVWKDFLKLQQKMQGGQDV